MPQRFLRPQITNSERWNSISFAAQSFFIRIITLVDDFGRCDGRPAVLCGQLYSVWNAQNPEKSVTPQEVAQMSQECAADSCGLLEIYEVEGKKVIQVTQWQERVRDGAKEKWPKNPNPLRIPADSCGFLPPSSPPPPPPSSLVPAVEHRTPPPPSPSDAPADASGRFLPAITHALHWLAGAQASGAEYTEE